MFGFIIGRVSPHCIASEINLRELASEKGVTYIDLYALLSDDNGYFLHEYAENDGLHFKGATYKVVLKYIEDII